MEYRNNKRCEDLGDVSVLSLGMGSIQDASDEEIEHIVRRAIVNGINTFDLCAGGKNIFRPVGRAISNIRKKLILQLHFGAGFDELGQYEWIRDPEQIKKLFGWQLKQLNTDYADVGILHCVDDEEDIESLRISGVIDYMVYLRDKGMLRHLGFSTHTPAIADKLLDMGIFDVMMISVNPEECSGNVFERKLLAEKCAYMGVTIMAMRVFQGGSLLKEETSPYAAALTKPQCIQFALDKKGVASAIVGVKNLEELDSLLMYNNASESERDYSVVGKMGTNNAKSEKKCCRPGNIVDIFSYGNNIAK